TGRWTSPNRSASATAGGMRTESKDEGGRMKDEKGRLGALTRPRSPFLDSSFILPPSSFRECVHAHARLPDSPDGAADRRVVALAGGGSAAPCRVPARAPERRRRLVGARGGLRPLLHGVRPARAGGAGGADAGNRHGGRGVLALVPQPRDERRGLLLAALRLSAGADGRRPRRAGRQPERLAGSRGGDPEEFSDLRWRV